MKKIIAAAFAAAFLLTGCGAYTNRNIAESFTESPAPTAEETGYVPLNYPEQVGIWLPYVKFPEYMQGKTEEEFRSSVISFIEDAAADNVNTLYFHVHPNGDAYYSSELYPKGAGLDGNYDPLEIVLEEAHKRGISVHAWLNPLRLQTADQMESVSDSFITKKWINEGEPYVRLVGDRWYLAPAYPETIQLLEDTVREILESYDVDGIHIDDYFYPTTAPDFDREAFEQSGETDLSAWRTELVSRYVKALHDSVKKFGEDIRFGISPQGNIDADYNSQFADVRRWTGEEGFCDYIVPQLYFGFENENVPFLPTLAQWEELTRNSDVSLIAGLAPYKLGREDKWAGAAGELEWINDTDIINKQIAAVKNSSADGYALY